MLYFVTRIELKLSVLKAAIHSAQKISPCWRTPSRSHPGIQWPQGEGEHNREESSQNCDKDKSLVPSLPAQYGIVTSTHQSWCVCSWGHCFWAPWPASHPCPPGIWISTCNNPHLLVGSPTLLPGNTPSPPSPRWHWVQMGLGRTEKRARKKQHNHQKVNIR